MAAKESLSTEASFSLPIISLTPSLDSSLTVKRPCVSPRKSASGGADGNESRAGGDVPDVSDVPEVFAAWRVWRVCHVCHVKHAPTVSPPPVLPSSRERGSTCRFCALYRPCRRGAGGVTHSRPSHTSGRHLTHT